MKNTLLYFAGVVASVVAVGTATAYAASGSASNMPIITARHELSKNSISNIR